MKKFMHIPQKCWYSMLTVLAFLMSSSLFAGGNFKGITQVEGNEFEVGEQFLVEYRLVASGSYTLMNPRFSVSPANFGELEVIQHGQDRSMSFGFGDNSVFKYKYFLKAKSPGRYTIPAITITMDGKKYATQTKSVVITPKTKDTNVAGDLMLQLKPNKNSVYVGESIRYDLYWYSAFQAKGFQMKELPKFDGFIVKTIQSDTKVKVKTINGKKYLTNKEYSFILTPIKPGKIKLPEVKGDVYLTTGRGFFQQTETREISTGRLTLEVKPLPSPPKEATEPILVGDYKLTTSIDKNELEVNDAITVRYKLSGNGNLNKISNMDIQFPSAFEALPPTSKDNVKTDISGIHGFKTFEFVAIPRQSGTFEIPSETIWAFNPKTKNYYNLKTDPIKIQVNGDGSSDAAPYIASGSGREVELQGSDIRYLNDIENLNTKGSTSFTGSVLQYILLFLVLGGFAGASFVFKERTYTKSEIKSDKKAKANKVVQKFLKDAAKEINGDKNKFYELVDEALNKYLLGKLMIEQSELNKTVITQKLEELKINTDLISATLKVSNDCKMARFSPMVLPPDEMYKQAENVINELERQIK